MEIVRLLLGAGADMDVEDRLDGTTALHQAVAQRGRPLGDFRISPSWVYKRVIFREPWVTYPPEP